MSDFDRNYAAARRGVGADRAVAIDQGLRAYMIRIYNYMAMGVALTGVAAWLTFQAAVHRAGRATGADLVRPDDLQRTGGDRSVPRHARAGVPDQLAHRPAAAVDGARAVHGLCGSARADAVVDLPHLYGDVDHARVLHLGGVVRRAEPLRLHHPARPVGDRIVPDHGPDRAAHRHGGQHVPQEQRARLRASPPPAS